MRFFRVHTADIAYITQQPRGIFTAIGKLVDAGIMSEEEIKEYWKQREYFERVLPVPPFYEKGNPDGAVTWFKETEQGKDIYRQMAFYRDMAAKYDVQLYISECSELPGEVIYEDEFQIAVRNQRSDLAVETETLKMVMLDEVRPEETEKMQELYEMMIKSFMPLYEVYHDDGSPATESFERFSSRVSVRRKYYFIVKKGIRVGGINIGPKSQDPDTTAHISPLFILTEYQNQGIGYAAVQKAFEKSPKIKLWKLDTILQEKRNCHLYEKCGFVRTGEATVINDKMTIISYMLQIIDGK